MALTSTALPPMLIALSGVTSSGKTTLARLLARIFPSTSILHVDDYYHTDSAIPIHHGVQDWDCAEAINLPKLEDTLERIRNGEDVEPIKKEMASSEVLKGDEGMREENTVELLKEEVGRWEDTLGRERGETWRPRRLVIVDGFLLFGVSANSICSLFDVRILLRAGYEDSKKRRAARPGYDTIEGWWEDPPDYFDQIVWPNFVKEHSFLFKNQDVHGDVDEAVSAERGINVVPGSGQLTLPNTLTWIVNVLKDRLQVDAELQCSKNT